MAQETTHLDRIRRLIERLAPAPICDDCISARLAMTPADRPSEVTIELAGADGFERQIDSCSLCGERRKVTRRSPH